jgi:hypothetical protein
MSDRVCAVYVCLCFAGSAANSPVSSGSGSGAGAQIVADGPLSCFVMKRSDFERLLGPYEELWRYEALRKVRCTMDSRYTSRYTYIKGTM